MAGQAPRPFCGIVVWARRLRRDVRGTVGIIGAFTLVSIIGIAGFSVELGRGYQIKIGYQGAADAAALAAANAYGTTPSDVLLAATALDIARANGIAPTAVTVTHLTDYSASVTDAVQVTIRVTVPIVFGRILSSSPSYVVTVQSVASLATVSVSPCIIALSSGGVALSGGTTLNAPNCAVDSDAGISVAGGSKIAAQATASTGATSVTGGSTISASGNIVYGTAISADAGSTISGTQVHRSNTTADPLANNAALAAAFAQLGSYTPATAPAVPTGTDLTLGYYPATMVFEGNTGTLSGSTWTFPAGTYNIRNLNTRSLTLKILGPSTVTVSAGVTVGGGGGLNLGDGPITIDAPISLSGGTSMTLGAGTHYLGQISVGGGSTATIGAGNLTVSGAILVSGGGSAVDIGAGNYVIGNDGSGNAITLSGGSTLGFGAGTFSAAGAITTSGGSTLGFGATANHYIDGHLSLNGSSTFGAGNYIVAGNFTNNTGGTMSGSGVTFVLAGTLGASGGTSINLSAPAAGATAGIRDVLFATRSAAATLLGGGTQDVYSGIVYVPNSAFGMSGGAAATGTCFSIIASSVTLASGPSASTACTSMGNGNSGGAVSLLQ